MRLKLIACEILCRELCAAVAQSPNRVDVEFLPKGLHDLGREGMFARLRAALEAVEESQYDAILLGYGLCNNGVEGLAARTIPVVIPRAHDCISLFLGSRQRYREYFDAHPGTYFKTTGWMEREKADGELSQLTVQGQMGMNKSYEQLVEEYGEDNARYLQETFQRALANYKQYTYITTGLGPDEEYARRTRELADARGWIYERIEGDMSLIRRLTDGPWDGRDFLTIQPGQRIAVQYTEDIIEAEGEKRSEP